MLVMGISLLKDCTGQGEYQDESDKELCHNDLVGMKIAINLTLFISKDSFISAKGIAIILW